MVHSVGMKKLLVCLMEWNGPLVKESYSFHFVLYFHAHCYAVIHSISCLHIHQYSTYVTDLYKSLCNSACTLPSLPVFVYHL